MVNRREFIRKTTMVAVAVSLPEFMACKDDKPITPLISDCLTTDDILGPFYKSGSPFRENIIPAGETGTPLFISGKVFTGCDTILKDAIVEIWNANTEGEYDMSDQFIFRGSYKTADDGLYRFKTIIPGRYLNGGTFRPSHIHFRITAPGHRELVSQIYFKDDPFIKDDPWAGSAKASERILTIGKDDDGIDAVSFDIYLTATK